MALSFRLHLRHRPQPHAHRGLTGAGPMCDFQDIEYLERAEQMRKPLLQSSETCLQRSRRNRCENVSSTTTDLPFCNRTRRRSIAMQLVSSHCASDMPSPP